MPKVIFVFGSNREGRHGKGAALKARREYGAIYGQAEGLQGNSYAIVTRELRKDCHPVTLEEVQTGVTKFLLFAVECPSYTFILSPIGCGLAGFIPEEIAPMFDWDYVGCPKNVILPDEFKTVLS